MTIYKVMKLNLQIQNQSDLLQNQKNLIKSISLFSAALIFISGTAMELVMPANSMGSLFRLMFVSLFLVSAFISSRQRVSMRTAEFVMAIAGGALLSKTLYQHYTSNFSSFHIISSALIIVGLSGVFISKISLIILAIPSVSFIFYTMHTPPPAPIYPSESIFILLACSSTVGYFLTWQKVYLLNKSLEQEIHKNTVINNLHEGTLLQNMDGKFLTTNQAALKILGLTKEQLIGLTPYDSGWGLFKSDGITPCSYEERPTSIARATRKPVINYPMILKRPGTFISYLECSASPIMSSQNPDEIESILLTVRDVTDLRRAQETLENQKIEMLAHSKLTSLGEMAAGIAHEINNPLTIILGRATQTHKLVEADKASKHDILQNLTKISDTTLRISKIVKSMKALSQSDQNQDFQNANLRSIVEDIINVTGDHIHKNKVQIQNDIDAFIELDCHPGMLSQVFINLMNNAIDAIKTQVDNRWIRIESITTNTTVIIAFKDSGPGIPTSLKDKIMLPFFTTKTAGRGTGIGLSLCRSIIENHKGRFYIDEAASTTCFMVELPLKQERDTDDFSSAA